MTAISSLVALRVPVLGLLRERGKTYRRNESLFIVSHPASHFCRVVYTSISGSTIKQIPTHKTIPVFDQRPAFSLMVGKNVLNP